MLKTIILYALALALLIFLLKFLEYQYFLRELKLEFYLSLIAVLFTTLGVWGGIRLKQKKTFSIQTPHASMQSFLLNKEDLLDSGISKRELDVLKLIAMGLSNQEIADQLFLSLNTVKTHTSNLYLKLDVKRRTQAIQKAKKMNLIP